MFPMTNTSWYSSLPTINMTETGKNINSLRIKNHMSVKDMQQMFGFTTPQAIYKWIHGTSMPTIDNMVILAEMFSTTVDKIIIVEK